MALMNPNLKQIKASGAAKVMFKPSACALSEVKFFSSIVELDSGCV